MNKDETNIMESITKDLGDIPQFKNLLKDLDEFENQYIKITKTSAIPQAFGNLR